MDHEIRYAKNGEVHIAYAVVGEGPIDLVYSPGIWSNLELMWEEPRWARYLDRLASFSRLIVFDMRGLGLSDRGPEPPILELQTDDVRAVMDAAGSETAAVLAVARGAAMTMLFAATYPERVRALVLYAPMARVLRAPDYPMGRTEEDQRAFFEEFTSTVGTVDNLRHQGPSASHEDDMPFRRWWARFQRLVATPGAFRELASILNGIDVRAVLPSIQAQTLVLHRSDDLIVPVAMGRYVAEHIPGARFKEFPGSDHVAFLGEQDPILDEIEEFLTGERHAPETDRVLATVLFTDIVGSTEHAVEMGDRKWRDLIASHHALVRAELARFRGREVDTAGDGFMATFDGPARAIRCAQAIVQRVGELGVKVRAGLHTGECEQMGEKLGGIAVHIAARVASTAEPGEVLVSQTVKDLVAGSGIPFEDRGVHELKGVPDPWHLFAVQGDGR
jgi:class 3 adenylate cyclase